MNTPITPEQWPAPSADLNQIVVIPCHQEPEILPLLESLARCERPGGGVEVLWVLNVSAAASTAERAQLQATLTQLQDWQARPWFQLLMLVADQLPPKHAGVGLARRLGMDLAAERLLSLKRPEGVIVCLDADCTVAANYFRALEEHFFALNPTTPACSLAFAHPLSGPLPPELYAGILRYELYLRYHLQGLRHAGLPHAFHTIGSSMAVRAGVYRAQGGMNRRKAGEDFYFLHKLIPLGGFTQLDSTTVIPSPRLSARVPFGTGRAMAAWLEAPAPDYPVYHPNIYRELRQLTQALPTLYPFSTAAGTDWLHSCPAGLRQWLSAHSFLAKMAEIQANSRSWRVFQQRFFRWFDGFKTLKFVHFARDQHHGTLPLAAATQTLGHWQGLTLTGHEDLPELLQIYRQLDAENPPGKEN